MDAVAASVSALRVVGDASAKPGDPNNGDPSVKGYATKSYDAIPAPQGAKRIRIEVDLSLYSGLSKDNFLILYGVDFSIDGGRTWPIRSDSTAGDNPVSNGFTQTSWQEENLPKDLGNGVLVRPFVGGKAGLDVGIKVEWL